MSFWHHSHVVPTGGTVFFGINKNGGPIEACPLKMPQILSGLKKVSNTPRNVSGSVLKLRKDFSRFLKRFFGLKSHFRDAFSTLKLSKVKDLHFSPTKVFWNFILDPPFLIFSTFYFLKKWKLVRKRFLMELYNFHARRRKKNLWNFWWRLIVSFSSAIPLFSEWAWDGTSFSWMIGIMALSL